MLSRPSGGAIRGGLVLSAAYGATNRFIATSLLQGRSLPRPTVCCAPAVGSLGRNRTIGGGGMTLLELGTIAKRYDTVVAHAMLHAVAVAHVRGPRFHATGGVRRVPCRKGSGHGSLER